MKTQHATRFRLPLLALLLGVGAVFSPISPVLAQAPVVVGVVDEDKLADGYTAYKNAVDALDKRAQSLDQMIPAREFLNAEDGKKFDELIVKEKPAAADQTALKTLVDKGMGSRATYMSLISKVNRTDKENTDMKAMQDLMNGNSNAVREVSAKLLTAIRNQQDATDKTYTDRANSVVAQVAGDKKLVMVVRKKALVWSADPVDITGEVLTRLNRAS